MEDENDVTEELFSDLGGDSVHPGVSDVYFAGLECTDWSFVEKAAFLSDPDNRVFLQEFGGTHMGRRNNLPVNDRDFHAEFSDSNRDRIFRLLATEGLFD